MHVPRMDRQGGGVGLLYSRAHKMERQDMVCYSSFEFLEFLLTSSNVVLRVGLLYRPPPSKQKVLTSTLFFNEFPKLLERLAVSSEKLLLLGDFNIHVHDCSDRLALRLLDLLHSHNLVQRVSVPTHKDNHTLDLVITRTGEDTILLTILIGLTTSPFTQHCH